MERKIKNQIKGQPAVDGAGVHLVRVLGRSTATEYSPFLMLDSFDSKNPDLYTKGFPLHPHRGIETISFLSKGAMIHKDSLGHEDAVGDGEVQWMTAGSGILHEEKLPPVPHILGVQLWLNLPKKHKMAPPAYYHIRKKDIPEIPLENGKLRLLAGKYKEFSAFQGKYQPINYYDIHLEANAEVSLAVEKGFSAFLFTLVGAATIGGEYIEEKTAALTTEGDFIHIKASHGPIELLLVSAPPLDEPIAWGGPIVMNSDSELQLAFRELREGTFLKEAPPELS